MDSLIIGEVGSVPNGGDDNDWFSFVEGIEFLVDSRVVGNIVGISG